MLFTCTLCKLPAGLYHMRPQETFFITKYELALLGRRARKRPATQSTPSATKIALAVTRKDRSSLAGGPSASTMLDAAKPFFKGGGV